MQKIVIWGADRRCQTAVSYADKDQVAGSAVCGTAKYTALWVADSMVGRQHILSIGGWEYPLPIPVPPGRLKHLYLFLQI